VKLARGDWKAGSRPTHVARRRLRAPAAARRVLVADRDRDLRLRRWTARYVG
jgi:hypothetical protein